MNELFEKIKDYYLKKGYNIELDKITGNGIKFNIISIINNKKYVEDLEILKEFFKEENLEIIKENFDYLIYNSLYRHLQGGEDNVSDKIK